MNRKRKVVYVIGTLGRGGAESQLVMLMRGIQEKGWLPSLFVLESGGDLTEEVDRAGIPIVDGGYDSEAPKIVKILLLLRAGWRLVVMLRETRPDVVHGALPLANLFSAVAGKIASVPLIITSRRALNTHQDRIRGWRYADILSSRLSDLIVANSDAVKNDTLKREGGDANRIAVIHNGIDFRRFDTPPDARDEMRKMLDIPVQSPVLIIVANLIPYKGHLDLIQALARLSREFADIILMVVGEDRGIGDRLRDEAGRLGIADAIRWLGLRRDVPRLLSAADIYVSASHEEGFSNSLLEALAAGLPVVATRVGGNPEMLEGGDIGMLVEPGDSDGLARVIRKLLQDSRRARRMGDRAAKRVRERYSPSRMVQTYMKCYTDRLP